MDTRDDWEALLDADPSSMDLRFLYADWLDEQGEWDGPAVREMAERGLYPLALIDNQDKVACWDWWTLPSKPKHSRVTEEEFVTGGLIRVYDTRREAEEDLRRVIASRLTSKVEVTV